MWNGPGLEFGEVVVGPKVVPEEEVVQPLKSHPPGHGGRL